MRHAPAGGAGFRPATVRRPALAVRRPVLAVLPALTATLLALPGGPAAAQRTTEAVGTTSSSPPATARVIIVLRDQRQAWRPSQAHRGQPGQQVAAGQHQVLAMLARTRSAGIHVFRLVNAISAVVPSAEARSLAADPQVAAVLPDTTVRLQVPPVPPHGVAGPPAPTQRARPMPAGTRPAVCPSSPSKPLLEPEGLELTDTASATGGPSAHRLANGAGVRVGILGGAIDPAMPELMRHGKPVIADYRDFTGEGVSAPTFILESFGDASAIAAQGTGVYDLSSYVDSAHPLPAGCDIRIEGVAPGATLDVEKVFSNVAAPTSTILAGIDWAVTHDRVNVLNESFDGYYLPGTAADAVRLFNDAAAASGVSVVVSAGDAGEAGTLGSPANDPDVISVGASTQWRSYAQIGQGAAPLAPGGWRSDNVSALSSTGPAQQLPEPVDVVAPGDAGWAACSSATSIYQTCVSFFNGGKPSPFFLFSGTSQAAPFVAGEAALVIQAYRRTHNGVTPAPALVRQIVMSPATDLGAPATVQGAGLINSLHAVQMAESIRPGQDTPAPARGHGMGLWVRPGSVSITGQPGARHDIRVLVTNTGAAEQTVNAYVRGIGQATTLAAGLVNLAPSTGTAFTDSDGTPAYAQTRRFSVPPGMNVLQGTITWRPASGGVADLSLVDPSGRLAGYSFPLGPSGYGQVTVAHPEPGVWRAVIWSRNNTSAYTGPVRFGLAAAPFTHLATASPAHVPLRPGQTARLRVEVTSPASPGDTTDSVVVRDGMTVDASIPVGLRSLIPTGPGGGHFSATIGGGNGLLAGAAAGGETLSYQFDLPAAEPGLSVSLRTAAPGYDIWGFLVSPSGMPLTGQAGTPAAAGPGSTVQIFCRDPQAGRWTLLVVLNGQVSSLRTQARVRGDIAFRTVPVTTSGLPTSTTTVIHPGQAVTAEVTVKNTGAAPLAVFGDARLNGSESLTLQSVVPATYQLPDTSPSAYPQFLVPPHASALEVTAASSVPVMLDTQPYWGGGFYSGDPDVAGSVGTHAAVTVQGGELATTTWVCDANEARPSPVSGTQASVTCAAAVQASPFASDVTASTGDFWLPAAGTSFQPVEIPPGQTGSFMVTIRPGAGSHGPVHGFIGIDMWNPQTHYGEELRDVPYAYTAG
ncbi:MAG TPA: S8 family serine peptidase [Streptosporangiaceae bacterium]|nr:S8 family serine peptidase [Streptosporangiaceae bacterium]